MEERASPSPNPRISDSTVRRLSRYYRSLMAAATQQREHISSRELGELNGVTSAQVRKDLSACGNFGRRGLGYPVDHLRDALATVLGLDRHWAVVLAGVGNIGTALLRYPEFRRQGFHIVVAFDVDQRKTGTEREGVPILEISELADEVRRRDAEIGIVAVPADQAQDVCDQMVSAGLQAILNFAPVTLDVPDHVTLRNEDMAVELESLSHALSRAPRKT